MSLTSRLIVQVVANLTAARDLDSAQVPTNYKRLIELADGAGAGQASKIFTDTRTLAPSGTEDLDLAAGGLVDALGAPLTCARVKVLLVAAAGGNVNNVVVGAAAANQFVGPFGAATHTHTLKPGDGYAWWSTGATAWPVTPGTGDLLRITNSGAGTPVTYDIVIIGA